MTVTVVAGRVGITLRSSKTQNRSCKRSYRPRCTDDYKEALHAVWRGNKKLGFVLSHRAGMWKVRTGRWVPACSVRRESSDYIAQPRDARRQQSTAPWMIRRRCRDCMLAHGTWSYAWGGRTGWSWAAENFSKNHMSTWVCSTSFSASCQGFAMPFFPEICICSLWYYPPLEAPLSHCRRQGLCTSLSAAVKISVFTVSALS